MILDKIVEDKKVRLVEHKKRVSLQEIQKQAETCVSTCDFMKAISKPGISIIGEFKQASPSMGEIKSQINLEERIKEYNESVDAISCLTEEDHFNGNIEYLRQIRKMSQLPILRKDFMIDEYQFYEAKAIGANAILLIAAILDDAKLKAFYQLATELGLDSLIEVHDEKELERALKVDGKIIGINNRNLNDFSIDLRTTERLAGLIPKEKQIVAESGILTDENVKFLKACNVDGFLIGRALMEAEHPAMVAKRWKEN